MKDIPQFIQNKSIEIQEKPFRHVIIDNFFEPGFYADLSKEFNKLLDMGLSDNPMEKSIFHRFKKYDAYSKMINPKWDYPFNFFYSSDWDSYLAGIFGIQSSKDTIANLHHHAVGSEDGWTHNDYSLCSFKEDRLPNGINPWFHQCIYEDSSPDRQPDTLKRMRSVVMMIYLCNDPNWKEGDGGETGLYRENNRESLVEKVAPINNRFFAFEISPYSYHGFLKNIKSPRNTIIQWLHEEPSNKYKKFGFYKPVAWTGY